MKNKPTPAAHDNELNIFPRQYGHWEVWLHEFACIGSGQTRKEAMLDARTECRELIAEIRRRLKNDADVDKAVP